MVTEDARVAKLLAEHYQAGWNEALENTAKIIDDYKFGDRFENLAVRKDLKNEIKKILKSDYNLDDVNVATDEGVKE